MNWGALAAETPWIQVHVAAALFALTVGTVQLAGIALGGGRPNGPASRLAHRILGYAWALAMLIVATTSFAIHEIRQWGDWSLIHLLSIMVLVSVPAAVWAARRGNVAYHRASMRQIYLFALIVTGAFTLLPGRVMHTVVFGP